MDKSAYKKVARAIRKAKNVALCIHMYPDGDAIGSMVALALCLKKLRKKFWLFSPSDLPRRYSFLPLYRKIRLKPADAQLFDLGIAIDCATRFQLGELYQSVLGRSSQTIEIDHHASRKRFGDIALVDGRAAAVGEIIYRLIGFFDAKIDKDMAVAMLVSIIVETGSFRLPSVQAETFRICADLIAKGIDYYKVVEKSYWSRSRAEAMLLGLCFSRIRFFKKGSLASSFVTLQDLRRLGAREEDVDPIADQIRTLRDVKVVVLFRQMPGRRWRVSLRSKGKINVGRVAEEFGGGGHPDVAGCFLEMTGKEKMKLLRRAMRLV